MKEKRVSMLYLKTVYHIMLVGILIGFLFASYVFAYQTFSNEPYNEASQTREVVVIKKNDTAREVARQLRKKHLIIGEARFRMRKFFSKYRNRDFKPGKYRISASQGMEDMIRIFVGENVTINERNIS